MKILHVIASANPRHGGPIQGVVNGAEVWRRQGHERHLATLDPPSAPWLAELDLECFAFGRERLRLPLARYGFNAKLVPWLKTHAANYDAVIVNGLWNYGSLAVWRALRGSSTPYFVFTHGMLDPWFTRAHPWKGLAKALYWRAIESRVLRDARAALFTCEEEKRLAAQAFSPYRARSCVVGYGARAPEYAPERQVQAFFEHAPNAAGRSFALYLGRIHEKKGVDLLIEAFARLASAFPDLDLVIAGPGRPALIESLRRRVAALGLGSRAHWPGMLSGDAKWGAFRAARFFVLPSHQENFGIAVAEALAAATPVLITDKVNIWREIASDGAGVVVPDTVAGVEQGLRIMAEMTPARHVDMSTRARASFCARYDLDVNAMDLLTLLSQLCANRSTAEPQPYAGEIFSSPPI